MGTAIPTTTTGNTTATGNTMATGNGMATDNGRITEGPTGTPKRIATLTHHLYMVRRDDDRATFDHKRISAKGPRVTQSSYTKMWEDKKKERPAVGYPMNKRRGGKNMSESSAASSGLLVRNKYGCKNTQGT